MSTAMLMLLHAVVVNGELKQREKLADTANLEAIVRANENNRDIYVLVSGTAKLKLPQR